MPSSARECPGSDPEEEEGESVASQGSLLESSGRSGTTWSGEAGGVVVGPASIAGGGGSVGCATCSGIVMYGTEGSKA